MTYYICGPMTGLPSLNYPAFDAIEKALRELGVEAFNPAAVGRRVAGDKPPSQLQMRAVMRENLIALTQCDGVVLLRGHNLSRGASIEIALARYLGLTITTQTMVERGTLGMEEAS